MLSEPRRFDGALGGKLPATRPPALAVFGVAFRESPPLTPHPMLTIRAP